MRDLVVREAVKTMTREAAKRFRALLASGGELPYDVRESGDGLPMPQYVPLTERFIRENAGQLRELDSFGAACAALESADLAGPYLERLEIAVPPEPRRRAELAAVVFLCRLWLDSTDFPLGDDRLNPAIEELEAGGELDRDEIEVIVPLRGLQMPVARLDLATATIVSADTVEVPGEARVAEGAASAGWEPTFLAVACVGMREPGDDESAPDAGARAVEAFRQVITALRLFKPGGVGLGAHAWARTGHDRWRRIATGAGRPRPGGYRLTEDEIGEVVAFSRALANRSTPFGRPARDRPGLAGALARSISRFEAGLERHAVLEALNDYLLAMRFLLEGAGPADLGLPIRVAALCSEPDRRDETKAVVDRALALERELWTGEPAPAADGALSPAAVAVAVEELARAILKDAACGHLGSDLRATADEILLADGLSVGEGAREQRGATAEWDLPEAEEPLPDPDEVAEVLELEPAEELLVPPPADENRAWEEDTDLDWSEPDDVEWGEPGGAPIEDEGVLKVPELAGRITVERNPALEEENLLADNHVHARLRGLEEEHPPAPRSEGGEPSRADELLAARPAERQRIADRVAYLFPRPETTEWSVREVAYDRTRRADVRHRRVS